jgi:hypothetical protein
VVTARGPRPHGGCARSDAATSAGLAAGSSAGRPGTLRASTAASPTMSSPYPIRSACAGACAAAIAPDAPSGTVTATIDQAVRVSTRRIDRYRATPAPNPEVSSSSAVPIAATVDSRGTPSSGKPIRNTGVSSAAPLMPLEHGHRRDGYAHRQHEPVDRPIHRPTDPFAHRGTEGPGHCESRTRPSPPVCPGPGDR